MVKFGRDSQGHVIQPLAQAGPPRNDDHVQMAFEYLQGGRLYNFPGQPVLGLSYSPSKKLSGQLKQHFQRGCDTI